MGWIATDDIGTEHRVYVRVAEQPDGRLRIVELYVDGSDSPAPITGDLVRNLPVAAIEAGANAYKDHVLARIKLLGPNLSTLATHYATGFMKYGHAIEERNWVALNFLTALSDEQIKEEVPDAPPFRRIKPARRQWRNGSDATYRLESGPTDGLTDEFLEQVKKAYDAAVLRRERPNKAIADQLGVPVKTVQRWVYLARQRNIMPRAGRRGVAG